MAAANPKTFFQMYWLGGRDQIAAQLDRARKAGAAGVIATLDWSFSHGRDWGSPHIPEKLTFAELLRLAPQGMTRPKWLALRSIQGTVPKPTAASATRITSVRNVT